MPIALWAARPPPAMPARPPLICSCLAGLLLAGTSAVPGCGQSDRDRHFIARSRVHQPVAAPDPHAQVRMPTWPPAGATARTIVVVETGGD